MIARGTIVSANGGLLRAVLPCATLGEGVRVETGRGTLTGVITALRRGHALIAAHDSIDGIAAGDAVCIDPAALTMPLGTALLGSPIDMRAARSAQPKAPLPPERESIDVPFWTGVRAIDALLTIGRGARIGVFGPPGCGKSTLLHLLMRGSYADAVVVGLVGERGREAEEWMRLCPRYATIACATSDRSAAERINAANVAMAQANRLRSRGLHVLLILDSLARFANAAREIALAGGEAAGRGGYPPSVFAQLAQLVEVAGATKRGSITLVASVLSDGDERDPVSEAARSLLDGHIALSPKLAQAGRFPAIDLVASTSRTMNHVVDEAHQTDAQLVRLALAALAQTEDARSLGIMPADPFTLRAIAAQTQLDDLLRQGKQAVPPAESLSCLAAAADILR
jgi:type III secretion protein N (ATPase)